MRELHVGQKFPGVVVSYASTVQAEGRLMLNDCQTEGENGLVTRR